MASPAQDHVKTPKTLGNPQDITAGMGARLPGSAIAPQARPAKPIEPKSVQQSEGIRGTRIAQFEQREDHRVCIGVIA
jgi:hypothetical protein